MTDATPDRSAWHIALDAALIAQTGDESAPMNVSAPDELWDALAAAGVRPELAAAVLLNDPRTEVIAWRPAAAAPVNELVLVACPAPTPAQPRGYTSRGHVDGLGRWRDSEGWPFAAGEVQAWAPLPTGPAAGEGAPC